MAGHEIASWQKRENLLVGSSTSEEAEILDRSGQVVKDIMRENPFVIPADEMLFTAAELMDRNDCTALLVEERGRIVGMITRRDIEKAYLTWLKAHL